MARRRLGAGPSVAMMMSHIPVYIWTRMARLYLSGGTAPQGGCFRQVVADGWMDGYLTYNRRAALV